MINKFKNIKLAKSVFTMALLAVIFTLSIGVLGFFSISKVNSNSTSIYNESVQPLGIGAGIRGEFANLRIEAHKAMLKYDPKHNESIMQHDKKIQDYLEQFSNNTKDPGDLRNISNFKSDYTTYLQIWDKVNKDLSSGKIMSDDDYNKMASAASDGETALFNIKTHNIDKAVSLNKQSTTIYSGTIRLFVVIIAAIILLFSVISYVVIRVIQTASKEMNDNLKILSTGNFSINLDTDRNNEFGVMKRTLSQMVKEITDILSTVKDNAHTLNVQADNLTGVADEMAASSENVASAIQDVSKGTSSQSEDLMAMNNTVGIFGDQIDDIVKSIENIQVTSENIGVMAVDSNEGMQNLVKSIATISESFKDVLSKVNNLGENINKINDITNLINQIAGQTNLLALNASIEAARAGEHGRGFSVVADEIRKLAEQCRISSENIYQIVQLTKDDKDRVIQTTQAMNQELNEQMNTANYAIASFDKIIEGIKAIGPKIAGVNKSANSINTEKNSILSKIEQTSAVAEEISASSEQIVASSQEMNASTEEVAAAAQSLNDVTKEMMTMVNKFILC